MSKVKYIKKRKEIIPIICFLTIILLVITVSITKSPNYFCNFISWLGNCEEETEICSDI